MKILFVHQNFPGQFKHLAPALAARGNQVIALSMRKNTPLQWQGVTIKPYSAARSSTPDIHPWLVDFETKVIRGEACLNAALELHQAGFEPDVIMAHPGWGESLFLKEVWPNARLGVYCEFFYRATQSDLGFDPEFSAPDSKTTSRLRLKNLNNLLHFEVADGGLSPTHWQASTFPDPFRPRISVIHDGIDTHALVPNHQAEMTLKTSAGQTVKLNRDTEVITFVNRNLEPYRGFHVFMRALPSLLRQRPSARVVIVGGDSVSYGAKPQGGGTWKEVMLKEMQGKVSAEDWSRVHFVGHLPYNQFVALLQVSTVHVYLTYPFVLSWSLLEAMSIGCTILASDTQPLHEAIHHDETGRLVDFFDQKALVSALHELLEDPAARARLSANARSFAREHYDLKRQCLPRQLEWVDALVSGRD